MDQQDLKVLKELQDQEVILVYLVNKDHRVPLVSQVLRDQRDHRVPLGSQDHRVPLESQDHRVPQDR